MRNINLKGLFTPQAVATALQELPPIKSTIIDLAFPASMNHELPHIGVAELQRVINTIPLVKRDGTKINLGSQTANINIFAPLPLMPSIDITASELNDLQALTAVSKQDWVTRKIEELRDTVRKTTEAMASVVITTGKFSWPTRLSGGAIENFEIDYGSPLSHTPAKMWDATDADIMTVYDTLSDMEETLQETGFGGTVEYMAGKTAFGHIVKIAQAWSAAAQHSPFSIKLEESTVNIGGYVIHRVAERYESPVNSSFISKVDPKKLIAFVKDSNAKVFYCAIDSLSANNQALPFYVYTDEKNDSVITLTAQAKPVPARNPKTINIAQVIS